MGQIVSLADIDNSYGFSPVELPRRSLSSQRLGTPCRTPSLSRMHLFRKATICVALTLPSLASAQTPIGGPPGNVFPAIILRLPASTRMLAMGNVGVAGRDDDVLFYNPAQLVAARGFSVSAEQMTSHTRLGALSAVTRFNTGGIAVGATMADFTGSAFNAMADRNALLRGGQEMGTSAALAVGVGQVFKRTRIGVAAKYVEERIAVYRNAGPAFDFGLGRDVAQYQLGLSVTNVGPKFDADPPPGFAGFAPVELPLKASLGAARSLAVGMFDLFATAGLSWTKTNFWSAAGGAELGYSWLEGYSWALRAGARRPEAGEGALTGGAAFNMDRLSIDYAIEALHATEFFPSGASHVSTRFAHRIGLRIR